MDIPMGIQFYVNLNNEYDFKSYCSQKSIEAFEFTIDNHQIPSRFSIISILFSEILTTPLYLAKKLVEITVNFFHLLNVKIDDPQPLTFKTFSNLTGMLIIQIMIPLTCTAIRIFAATIGFFFPSYAIQGWKLAESGEKLSYLLWSDISQEFQLKNSKKDQQVYEEVVPSSAIFYLGETQTRLCLENEFPTNTEIDKNISKTFSTLLQTILLNYPDYFFKLLDFEKAIDPSISFNKNYPYYHLDYEAKQILLKLQHYISDPDIRKENFIAHFLDELTPEEMQGLFHHVYLNLRFVSLETHLIPNSLWMTAAFIQLKDLFSQRFRFGRAHYSQSLNSCYLSTSD